MRDSRGVSNVLLAGAGAIIAVIAVALVVAVLVISDDDGSDDRTGFYVSLGDSVAAGNGASDPASTSFTALVAEAEDAELRNFARAGATTQDVLDEQIDEALALLRSGNVRMVTISAGGNDLAALIPNPACVEDPLPASCPLDDTLDGISQRLDEILRRLREANDVPIVLLGYPNFFAGTDHAFEAPAGAVLRILVDAMQSVASKYERVTVARASFDDQTPSAPLTHVLDEQFDPHPNDAGHRIIADAVLAELEDAR